MLDEGYLHNGTNGHEAHLKFHQEMTRLAIDLPCHSPKRAEGNARKCVGGLGKPTQTVNHLLYTTTMRAGTANAASDMRGFRQGTMSVHTSRTMMLQLAFLACARAPAARRDPIAVHHPAGSHRLARGHRRPPARTLSIPLSAFDPHRHSPASGFIVGASRVSSGQAD